LVVNVLADSTSNLSAERAIAATRELCETSRRARIALETDDVFTAFLQVVIHLRIFCTIVRTTITADRTMV
jgi:hypothetical protein